tara:strand:+ start:1859 stop:2329 length:471 start_codon:yes stop_codon:yes gene_type:complete
MNINEFDKAALANAITSNMGKESELGLGLMNDGMRMLKASMVFTGMSVSEVVAEVFPDYKADIAKATNFGPPVFKDPNNANNYSRKAGAMASAWLKAEDAKGTKFSTLINPDHPQFRVYVDKYVKLEKEAELKAGIESAQSEATKDEFSRNQNQTS